MSLYEDHEAVASAEWLAEQLETVASDDPAYRLVEVDMDPSVYDEWHIPGAVQIDWETDLIDGLGGTLAGAAEVSELLGDLGITEDTTVIVYGDRANWFAGHAYWLLSYYGHDDVKLLDGGRRYWQFERFETTDEPVSVPTREYEIGETDESIRAYRDGVMEAIETDADIVDVRNPQEYRGESPPAEIPNTTDVEGHIPTAENVPWGEAVNADGTLKPPVELREIYGDFLGDEDTVTYCRIGERSSITWFVLSELLDTDAANYDGSWTEWAREDETPIETGETPVDSSASPEAGAESGGDD